MNISQLDLSRDSSEEVIRIGNGISFLKVPRNRLGTVSVIPRKKVPIPRHSEFRGRANSEARNGTKRNGLPRKNEVLGNLHGLYDDNLLLPLIQIQKRETSMVVDY